MRKCELADIREALRREYGHPYTYCGHHFVDFTKHPYVGRACALLFEAERTARKVTDEEIRAWAERHDIQGSDTTLRCIFEDAQTGVPSVTAGPNSPDGEQR